MSRWMLPRAARRWLSGTLIAALLLMQFAAAAHACDGALRGAAPMAAASDAGCPGHAAGQRADAPADDLALCKAHCERGAQSAGAAAAALDAGASGAVLVAVLDWAADRPLLAPAANAAPCLSAGAPPPGRPPIYLSLLVLRN